MYVPACNGCMECQTTLEVHPNYHKPLQQHKWKDGICSVCYTYEKDYLMKLRKEKLMRINEIQTKSR